MKAAGAQLATDAGAAGLASPSVGRYPYKQAMLAYYAAGTAASLGLYADSARGLRLGTRYLAQTATAFKAATP